MRIILIGPYLSNVLLIELGNELIKNGYEVQLIDIFISEKYDFVQLKSVSISNNKLILILLKVKYLRLIVKKMIAKGLISKQPLGTIVNLHFVSPFYIPFAKLAKKRKLRWVSTIWGSDFLRASPTVKIRLRDLFEISDTISMVDGLLSKFKEVYPSLAKKVSATHFGLSRLDINISDQEKIDLREEFKIPLDKTIVCVGNNGHKAQQHHEFLDAIEKNSSIEDKRLHLVFPMTYALNNDYLTTIVNKCKLKQISYSVINRRCSNSELASIQSLFDVIIFIQKTDAFSAFLCESIYRGAIPIVGSWLPYKQFDTWGFKYYSTSIIDLKSVIDNLNKSDLEKTRRNNTATVGRNLRWSDTITSWKLAYSHSLN